MKIQFKFDGACNNHQEVTAMGIGVAVFVNDVYEPDLSIFKGYKASEQHTSNEAEWLACIEAMKLVKEYKQPLDQIEIFSDSQLITNQFNGEYKINKDNFLEYYGLAKILARKAGNPDIKIKWVRREFNKEADELSKKGLAEARSN